MPRQHVAAKPLQSCLERNAPNRSQSQRLLPLSKLPQRVPHEKRNPARAEPSQVIDVAAVVSAATNAVVSVAVISAADNAAVSAVVISAVVSVAAGIAAVRR
jgi:hypothetical protein